MICDVGKVPILTYPSLFSIMFLSYDTFRPDRLEFFFFTETVTGLENRFSVVFFGLGIIGFTRYFLTSPKGGRGVSLSRYGVGWRLIFAWSLFFIILSLFPFPVNVLHMNRVLLVEVKCF